MYEQIIEFMNTPVCMYLMVVWAIMLPAFLYAFHYHWEIAAMEGFKGELIKVLYLTVASYEVIGMGFVLLAIASVLK